MAYSEETKFTKIEINLNCSDDVFIQVDKNILRDGEVISSSIHRYAISGSDEQALAEILAVSGMAAKIAELKVLIEQ